MVAAAIIGGAVVAGAATSYAGSEAAGATKSATNASINAQEQAQAKQQALNAPYAAIGTGGAIQQYQKLLGLGTGGTAGELTALQQTPGYQFTQQQGNQATVNQASSMGLGLSGNTLEGLSQYNTGLADNTYQNAVGNAQNAVTIGQNAAAGTGAGVLQTGAGVAGALTNEGNTIAGIDVNEAAGLTKALSGGASQYTTYNTLQGLGTPSSGLNLTSQYSPGGSANAPVNFYSDGGP
jgi:hypothetical protein